MGGKLDELHPQDICSVTNPDPSIKWKKANRNDGRITPKAHAHLQTMKKTPAKFQKKFDIKL